jgi:hypothetical protein
MVGQIISGITTKQIDINHWVCIDEVKDPYKENKSIYQREENLC